MERPTTAQRVWETFDALRQSPPKTEDNVWFLLPHDWADSLRRASTQNSPLPPPPPDPTSTPTFPFLCTSQTALIASSYITNAQDFVEVPPAALAALKILYPPNSWGADVPRSVVATAHGVVIDKQPCAVNVLGMGAPVSTSTFLVSKFSTIADITTAIFPDLDMVAYEYSFGMLLDSNPLPLSPTATLFGSDIGFPEGFILDNPDSGIILAPDLATARALLGGTIASPLTSFSPPLSPSSPASIPQNPTAHFDFAALPLSPTFLPSPPISQPLKKPRNCLSPLPHHGLTNLGNTCFMSSSLQCLFYNKPLREFFTGDRYLGTLNRNNKDGCDGELAAAYANLCGEMAAPGGSGGYWGGGGVAPRAFKQCLGKYAPQFLGYDQHDSQELAMSVIDKLKEDCNLVVGEKPYVENLEQGSEQTDADAAAEAWSKHLKREDSFVQDIFMGQYKSILTCPTAGCDRVSTTFDPFMNLTVDVPGLNDVDIYLTVVYPNNTRTVKFPITVKKTESLTAVVAAVNEHLSTEFLVADCIFGDIYNDKIHTVFQATAESGDLGARGIHAKMFVLEPKDDSTWEMVEKAESWDWLARLDQFTVGDGPMNMFSTLLANSRRNTKSSYHTDGGGIMGGLGGNNAWGNPNNSTPAVQLAREHIDQVRESLSEQDEKEEKVSSMSDQEEGAPTPEAINAKSTRFRGVLTEFDCEEFSRALDMFEAESSKKQARNRDEFKDGIECTITHSASYTTYTYGSSTIGPVQVMRVPKETTVAQLRDRIEATLRQFDASDQLEGASELKLGDGLLRKLQIKCKTQRKSSYSYHNNCETELGMQHVGLQNPADPSHPEEAQLLGEVAGGKCELTVHWCSAAAEAIDKDKWALVEDMTGLNGGGENVIQLTDCIQKFSEREQLTESEAWYCNKCKCHVRAFKEMNIWRAPPYVIIQLKRFSFRNNSRHREKIDALVNFPLTCLDLSSVVLNKATGSGGADVEPLYDCYAVSNHFGGMGFGHYTAYAKDAGKWYNFDDSSVREVNDESEVVSEAAYCLYYRRRDVVEDDADYGGVFKSGEGGKETDEEEEEEETSCMAMEEEGIGGGAA